MKEYHIHTFRCKHAQGDVSDYAKAAQQKGYETIGMSDHLPLPDNLDPEIRMDLKELGDYVKAIEVARKNYPALKILKGMECEYIEKLHDYYIEELRGKWGLQYLILGQHIFKSGTEWVRFDKGIYGRNELIAYTDFLIKGICSGIFDFVAHPDAFGAFYLTWDAEATTCSRAILDAVQDMGIPIEINTHGFRKEKINTPDGQRYLYPLEPFWELVTEYDISVVVSSDAHRPEDIGGKIDQANKIVDKYNLRLADLSYLEK